MSNGPIREPVSEEDGLRSTISIRGPSEGSTDRHLAGQSQHKSALQTGAVLNDRYVLREEIGRGGMGVVFAAHDERLGRLVAVKGILQKDRPYSQNELHRARSLFEQEARLGAQLLHPAIATVFDFGLVEQTVFAVFEYVPGTTLRDVLRRRQRIPLEEVRDILPPIAHALDYAHSNHIVHRDLKPENIRVNNEGRHKILDLGLARLFTNESDWRFAGTPAYASPEQCAEQASDGRADQYALGLIVFEMLTGKRPFTARSAEELYLVVNLVRYRTIYQRSNGPPRTVD